MLYGHRDKQRALARVVKACQGHANVLPLQAVKVMGKDPRSGHVSRWTYHELATRQVESVCRPGFAAVSPAVLFAAKSTEDKKGLLPVQLRDSRELAATLGYVVAADIQDEAKSAYHGNRGPGLEQAMAQCEQLGTSTAAPRRSFNTPIAKGRWHCCWRASAGCATTGTASARGSRPETGLRRRAGAGAGRAVGVSRRVAAATRRLGHQLLAHEGVSHDLRHAGADVLERADPAPR